MSAKKKQAAAKSSKLLLGICFFCAITEQTSDEIGQRARKRGFARLDDIMSVSEKNEFTHSASGEC